MTTYTWEFGSDADGLKFRIMESDVLQAQVLAIGGNPQKMAFGEVYQALQTGAIDAQENTWSNNYSSKFYEVQPYFMESNHGYLGYLVAVNPTFWAGLPDDVRNGLEEIMAEVTAWGNAQSAAINAESLALIEDSGRSEVIRLSPEELSDWQEAVRPVWQEFEGVPRPLGRVPIMTIFVSRACAVLLHWVHSLLSAFSASENVCGEKLRTGVFSSRLKRESSGTTSGLSSAANTSSLTGLGK